MPDRPTTPEPSAATASQAKTTGSQAPAPAGTASQITAASPGEAASTAETARSASGKRRRVPVWLRVFLGLVCYVLSIGPMFWVWHSAEYFGGNPLVRVFYTPLRLLCSIPFVEDWLNRYINWWIQ